MLLIKKILILDDSPFIEATINALKSDYEVTWVDCMEDLIEKLEIEFDRFDIVILDANVPGCECDLPNGEKRYYNDPDGLNSYAYFFDKDVNAFDEYKTKRVAFLTAYSNILQKRTKADNRTSALNEYKIIEKGIRPASRDIIEWIKILESKG